MGGQVVLSLDRRDTDSVWLVGWSVGWFLERRRCDRMRERERQRDREIRLSWSICAAEGDGDGSKDEVELSKCEKCPYYYRSEANQSTGGRVTGLVVVEVL